MNEIDIGSGRKRRHVKTTFLCSVKRMCRVSLLASTMMLLHDGLRCSGATSRMSSREDEKIPRKRFHVPHGTILPLWSTSIFDNLLSKNVVKSRVNIRLTEFYASGFAARKNLVFSVLKAVQ